MGTTKWCVCGKSLARCRCPKVHPGAPVISPCVCKDPGPYKPAEDKPVYKSPVDVVELSQTPPT